jgi:hypothetical protein
MTNKGRLGIGFGLLCASLVVLFFVLDGAWYNQPLTDTAGATLSRQPNLRLVVECSYDLIGFSPGDAFDFYEYSTTIPFQGGLDSTASLPSFRLRGKLNYWQAADSVPWHSTPIRSQDSLWTAIAEFGNLHEFRCSQQFLEKQYLQQPGNYYAAYTAYPLGILLYVWVPTEQKLFVIKKKGNDANNS